METVSIDGISFRVSRIGLGTWAIGGWLWGGSGRARVRGAAGVTPARILPNRTP